VRLPPQSFFANTQTLTADKFNVLSGAIAANPDGSISVNVSRVRTLLNQPLPGLRSINYHFQVLGDSPTVKADSDGVTRKGVVLWADVVNACNLVFLSCRTDDREAPGTTVIEGQLQSNPSITGTIDNAQLNSCAGIGYSVVSKRVLNIDIMDGKEHDFLVKIDSSGFQISLDQQSLDVPIGLPDTGLYGLRTDNVDANIMIEANTRSSFL